MHKVRRCNRPRYNYIKAVKCLTIGRMHRLRIKVIAY